MASPKKRKKPAPKKVKPRAVKKSKPKASPKKKAKAVKKAPAKAKAIKKASAKPKSKAVKKAKPKAASKKKAAAPRKEKEAAVLIPEKTITRDIPQPVPASRGEAVVSETTLDRLYIVNDSTNNITLEVKVGDRGQTSDMTIKLDDAIIAEEHAGDFNQIPIGKNNELKGKKLSIVATIADTSQETNLTSLTIFLKGGFAPATFPLSKEVSEEGGSVDYMALIEFFRPD